MQLNLKLPLLLLRMEKMKFEKSGIIGKNPYKDASNNVCLELIQLLLVVEKIKASKVGMNALESLESLHNFLKNQENIRGYFPQAYYTLRAPKDEADKIFSMVCQVLDTKQQPSFNDFLIEVNSYINQLRGMSNQLLDKQTMEHQEEFWLTIAPELINKHGYDFKSLQNDALGYSHLSIVYAYKNAEQILDVIKKLYEMEDSKIVDETIKNHANEIQLDYLSVLKKSERSIHFRHQINLKICLGFVEHFFQLVEPVKKLFAIDSTPYENYDFKVAIENEEYQHAFRTPEICDVVTIKLPRETFNHAKDSGTDMLLNRVILARVWDAVNEQSVYRSHVDAIYHLENLSNYSYWARSQSETLLNIELSKGRKLSILAMMRGLEFSYWFYSAKAKQQKRLNIGEAVKLYVEEKELKDSAATVKFSFEAIKRVAKTELVPLICKQLFWRLNNDLPSIMYCFCPLNDTFYQKVKHTVSEIKNISGLQVDIENYSSLLENIVQIEELLRNDNRANCRDSDLELSLPLGHFEDDRISRRRLKESIKHKDVLFILKP